MLKSESLPVDMCGMKQYQHASDSDMRTKNTCGRAILDGRFQALRNELLDALGEPEKENENPPTPLQLVA